MPANKSDNIDRKSSPSRNGVAEDTRSMRTSHKGKDTEVTSPRRRASARSTARSTTRSTTRSKSQMTYDSEDTEGSPSPEPKSTTMEALEDIDEFYVKLNRKHRREIRDLKKECENQQKEIRHYEITERKLRKRLTEAEVKNKTGVSKETGLENKVSEMEARNAELEADIKLITKQYEELDTKYREAIRKEKTAQQNLEKANKKINQLGVTYQNKSGDLEKRLRSKIRKDAETIEAKDREIENLKKELGEVRKKSNSIRDELSSANRRKSTAELK